MTRVCWYKKGLVVGIIILFIGVGIQPVFAEKTFDSTLDSEDCIEVQVSNGYSHLRVNLLLTRLKAIVNFMSYRSRCNPEVKEEYEEISNKIIILAEMNEELKIDSSFEWPPSPLICSILLDALEVIGKQLQTITAISKRYPILQPLATILSIIYISTFNLFYDFECDEFFP
jgi:hypothetical protein